MPVALRLQHSTLSESYGVAKPRSLAMGVQKAADKPEWSVLEGLANEMAELSREINELASARTRFFTWPFTHSY